MQKTSILLVGPSLLFRQSLAIMLNANPNLDVVGEAESMKIATSLFSELKPQLVILDTDLEGMNRFELLKFMKTYENEAKVLLLTSGVFAAQARQIINTGVKGYLTKYSTTKELMEAITEVVNGNIYFDNIIRNQILESITVPSPNNKLFSLTKKEMDIVTLLQGGFTSKQMAEQLRLSPNTIMTHRYNILKKLNLKNSASLVNFIHFNYC